MAEGGGALRAPRAFLGNPRERVPEINTAVRVVGGQSWGRAGMPLRRAPGGLGDLKSFTRYTRRQCKGWCVDVRSCDTDGQGCARSRAPGAFCSRGADEVGREPFDASQQGRPVVTLSLGRSVWDPRTPGRRGRDRETTVTAEQMTPWEQGRESKGPVRTGQGIRRPGS